MISRNISVWTIAVTLALCLSFGAVQTISKGATDAGSFPWGIFSKNVPIDTSQFPLKVRIENMPLRNEYLKKKVGSATELFYYNDLETQWLDKKGPTRLFKAFDEIVHSSVDHGLLPDDYGIEDLNTYLTTIYDQDEPSHIRIADADVRITMRFFQFCVDLTEGRTREVGDGRGKSPEELSALLTEITRPRQLRRAIRDLQPDLEQYEPLKDALMKYRELDKSHPAGTFQLDTTQILQPGDSSESIGNIARRISLTDEDYSHSEEHVYSSDLVQAVKRFQARHGLNDDGILGPQTLRQLNKSFEEKARQIAANLDRLRWLPEERTKNSVVVNIPDFRLSVYEGDQQVMTMKVIVGDEYHSTPVLIDTLQYITFSPTWTVPHSIIEEEVIPRLKKDPRYYEGKNFVFYRNEEEIDPAKENWDDPAPITEYKVVQQPGPTNALGAVKFMMPNALAIYLHDTPADHLFAEESRAYSHGCIRVEKPVEFARYLLRDQGDWDEPAIRQAMTLREPKNVSLTKRYQVEIIYLTCWIDDEGQIQFRDDLYDLDQVLDENSGLP